MDDALTSVSRGGVARQAATRHSPHAAGTGKPRHARVRHVYAGMQLPSLARRAFAPFIPAASDRGAPARLDI